MLLTSDERKGSYMSGPFAWIIVTSLALKSEFQMISHFKTIDSNAWQRKHLIHSYGFQTSPLSHRGLLTALPAFDTRVQNSHALHARKLHKSPINSICDTPKLIRWALYQFLEMWWNTVCVTHLMLVHLECLPNTYEFTIISTDISQYYMNQEIKVLPFPLLLNHPHLILDHCNGSNITSLIGLTQ